MDTAKRLRAGNTPKPIADGFRAIISVNADAMVVQDCEGCILYANPAVEPLFGLPAAELIRSSFGFPVVPDKPVALQILRWHGDSVEVEMRAVEVVWAGEPYHLLSFREMKNLATADQAVSQSRERLEILVDRWKQADGALHVSDERLCRFNRAHGIGLFEWDGGRDLVSLSPEAHKLLGSDPGSSLTLEICIAKAHPDDRVTLKRSIAEARENARNSSIVSGQREFRVVHEDGSVLWLEAAAMYNFEGGALIMRGAVHDITGRRQAEEALRVSEERLRRASSAGRIGLFEWNVGRDYVYFSPETYELYGISPDSLASYETWLATVHPDDREMAERTMAEAYEKARRLSCFSTQIEYRLLQPKGAVLWLLATATCNIEDGDLIARGAVRDITERKRAEEALRVSEARLRHMSRAGHIGLFEWNADRELTYYSPETYELYGLDPCSPVTLEKWLTRIHPDDREMVERRLTEDGESGRCKPGFSAQSEFRVVHDDGAVLWLEAHSTYSLEGGDLIVRGAVRDITGRKRAEEALRKSEASLARSQAITRLGNWEMDVSTGCIRCSDELYRIFNAGRDEPLEAFGERLLPEDRERVNESVNAAIYDGKPYNIDYRIVPRPGEVRHVHAEGETSYDRTGRPLTFFGTVQDITERKRAEKELANAKSQAELYLDLMGHDINNKNQIAMGFLELLASDGSLDPGLRKISLSALHAVSDSSQIIANVRKLHGGRSGDYKSGVFDLGALIEEVAGQYRSVPDKNVNVSLETVEGVRVQADELLKDVFANLIGNAIKHSDRDAFISIGMVSERRDDRQYCLVTVEDHGPGVADVAKDRVFNRMQRGDTRATGSGLGLYLVKSLVNGYGGSVWVEDRVKGDHTKGAKFVVMLPAIDV